MHHDATPTSADPLVVSYLSVRRAVGVTGLLLPLLLWPGAWLVFGVPVQDNMSAYYHTPARDVFVGALFTMGVFLYCYRGHDWVENWSANVGSVSALGLALFPLDAGKDPLEAQSWVGYLHMAFGAALFLTLAFYSLVHFPSYHLPDWRWTRWLRERSQAASAEELEPHELERNLIYWASGLVILTSMAAMGAYLVMPAWLKAYFNAYHFLFWMEWIALWAFAMAWLTKGRAIVADLAVAALALPTEFLKRQVGRKR
jgi:hypothetical protein